MTERVTMQLSTPDCRPVYRQEYGGQGLWVRPKAMFLEMVEMDGQMVPRFEYIGPQ